MEQDIKIAATIEANRPDTCRFTADRPIYPEGSAFFADRERAHASGTNPYYAPSKK